MNTNLALVHNQGTNNHEATLREALANADEIYIAVAFMKKHAVESLLPVLKATLERGATAKILVGTDFYLTEPAALTALHDACRPYPKKTCARMVQQGKDTFHPKVYCAVHGQQVTMLLGSANLTGGGMHSNFELSLRYSMDVLSPTFQALKTWLADIQTHKRIIDLDELTIGPYQVKYDNYWKLVRPAERKAQDEASQRTFDPILLQRYAEQYKADQAKQSDWAEKQNNYRRAREVLDKMTNTPPASRAEFLDAYGSLVGTAGATHLWHSSGIHRLKTKVANHYPRFLAMLHAIRPAIGGAPSDVFECGMSRARQIEGLGPNVVTEIMNTYAPHLYSVLNRNPIASLRKMYLRRFPDPSVFGAEKYGEYNNLMQELVTRCGFADLSQADHFMNYVYWKYVKGIPSTVS
jgi:HKD family nuclease